MILLAVSNSARDLALVGLVATAPLVLVVMIALLRGYTIFVHMTREPRRRSKDDG